jgi:predicted phage replisome organizer
MFDDEKIKVIEKMPEGASVLLIWIKLLALAGRCNANGYIYLSENIPCTDEMLATIFNMQLGTVRLALTTFQKFQMIEIIENKLIRIVNWEKHQNVDGMEKIREQTRRRVSDHRNRARQNLLGDGSNVTCNVTVTQCNETEVERDKEEDIEYTSSTKASTPDYVNALDYYSEKTGVLIPSANDIFLAKQLIEKDNIPLDIIKSAIDAKITKYKPKHKQDKIRCLSYFEGKIRDIWAVEQAKAVKTNADNKGSGGQANQESRIGITFDDE